MFFFVSEKARKGFEPSRPRPNCGVPQTAKYHHPEYRNHKTGTVALFLLDTHKLSLIAMAGASHGSLGSGLVLTGSFGVWVWGLGKPCTWRFVGMFVSMVVFLITPFKVRGKEGGREGGGGGGERGGGWGGGGGGGGRGGGAAGE